MPRFPRSCRCLAGRCLVFLAIAAMSSALAACSLGQAAPSPRNGGTITVALPSMPVTLNPLVSNDAISERAYTALFPLLFTAQADLSVGPQLASGSPQFSGGGRIITVPLHQDAHWSDGTPVTAADVVYTITAERDPSLQTRTRVDWTPLSQVTAVNAHTVRFTLTTPDAAFIANRLVMPVVPAHALASTKLSTMGSAPFNSTPTITGGPFRYATRDASSITFDANPSFFLGRPHADHLRLRVVANDGTVPPLLGEGAVSFDPDLSPAAAAQAVISSGVTVQSFADTSFTAVQFNVRPGRLFNAQPVRQAFADSIDHDTLVAAATGAANDVPVWSDINPASWAYSAGSVIKYGQDVSAARRLLGSAHPQADLLYPQGDAALQAAAARLTQEANAAGFTLTPKALSDSAYATALSSGGFDAAMVTFATAIDPNDAALYAPGGGRNLGGYDDAAVDTLLQQELAATAPSLTALNRARAESFARIEQLVGRDLPLYFLWSARHNVGFSATLGGVAGAGVQLDADRDNTFYLNWYLIG